MVLQLVSVLFWGFFTYNRNLVCPEIVDEYVPPYVNHMMHTSVAVFAVLEMLLRPHSYPKGNHYMMILNVSGTLYLIM